MTKTIVNHCGPNERCRVKVGDGDWYLGNNLYDKTTPFGIVRFPNALVFENPLQAADAIFQGSREGFEILPAQSKAERRVNAAFNLIHGEAFACSTQEWEDIVLMRDLALAQARSLEPAPEEKLEEEFQCFQTQEPYYALMFAKDKEDAAQFYHGFYGVRPEDLNKVEEHYALVTFSQFPFKDKNFNYYENVVQIFSNKHTRILIDADDMRHKEGGITK